MLDLANSSDISVCLEGVETEEQLQIIHDLRADCLQGYIFSKPIRAEEFEDKFINEQSAAYQEYKSFVTRFAARQGEERKIGSHLFWPTFENESGYDIVSNNRENILRRVRMGLWIMRLDQDKNKCEMYMDANCADILGFEKALNSVDAYLYWNKRICDECREYVDYEVQRIIEEDNIVQLEYWWEHPQLGRVRVRCVGVRAADSSGMITLKGYHRIVSDIETTNYEDWLKEQH